MPPPYDANMSLQNHPYPPGNQQYPLQTPIEQPPPMHVPQMQYTQSNGNPQYLGPSPQNRPYYAQQPDMQKPVYPPTSVAYPPTSAGYAPLPQQGYDYQGHLLQQNVTSNTTVVVAGGQIPAAQLQVIHEILPNYAVLSWLVCLCCCWPIGIAAIMASSRVDSAVANGNIIEARTQSGRAKALNIAGIICGIMIIIAFVTVCLTFYSSN